MDDLWSCLHMYVMISLLLDRNLANLRFLAVCGDILQSGAQNPIMMTLGRFLAGTGCGILLSIVPVYMAEVSPPKRRGFIVGLQGLMMSVGYMLGNWIGFAASRAFTGQIQWRMPLGMQIPGPLLLFFGCFLIPY